MTTGRTDERDKDADKKRWNTPKLKVFVRLRAEEVVLWKCRVVGDSGFGTHYGGCYSSCSPLTKCHEGS